MADEKRVKLGVDIGELSNQLVQINNVIEQNYQKALQDQSEYNRILEQSLELLQRQSDLVGQLGQQNQMVFPSAPQSESIGGGEDEASSKLNELVEGILDSVNSIWEKFSSLASPIPVDITNNPLNVKVVESVESGGGSSGSTGGNGGSNQDKDKGSSGKNTVTQGMNIAAGATSDPNYLVAGLVGMTPVIGAGLASVISKMISEAEQRVKAQAVFQGATGGNMPFASLHGIGLKDAEAYRKEAQYYPANIHLSLKDLEFEKGYNVGSGTMSSLLRAMREDVLQEKYGTSSSELGVTYLTQLRGEGNIDSRKIRGYTEDYLKILIDLNQKQLETTGETNSLVSGEVVAGIAKTSEKFGDPTVLQRVVEGIEGGLTQAPSAQTEALQYWAMSQANPEADIWQMQLMRENPFSEESRGYFSNYLNALLQTGNANDVRFNVMNAFGLTAHQTEAFLNGIDIAKTKSEDYYSRLERGENLTEEEQKEYEKLQGYLVDGKFNLTNYLEGVDLRGLTNKGSTFTTNAGAQISREAGRATAENEVLLAKAADRLANIGEPILEFTSAAIKKTDEVIEKLTNFFGNSSIKDSIKEALSEFHQEYSDARNSGTVKTTETAHDVMSAVSGGIQRNVITPNSNSSVYYPIR